MASEVLDLVESLSAQEASVDRLFNREGSGMRSSRRIQTWRQSPEYRERLREAVHIYESAFESKRGLLLLQEALTTADFPLLFGDIIDRQLLANYRETPQTYRGWCRIAQVSDFRTVKRFAINGSEAVLATVGQQEEYPESKLSDLAYQYSVKKYGRGIPFAWEDMVNDDLDALKDIPKRFGRAARRSEEKFATQLLADANGPNALFFTVANKNQVTVANGSLNANPSLSINALQQAFTVLMSQRDADGEPIAIEMVHLIVPPALEVVAQNILNATELWLNAGGGGDPTQQVHTVNWMKNRMTLHVDYYLPIVTTNAQGNTAWYLVAEPADSRPAFEVGFLRGHPEPEVFMKDPNAIRIGGGSANPLDGDFDTDSIRYKVRHVFGGVQEDPKMAVASTGQNV